MRRRVIVATFELLPTEASGHIGPIRSGYRSLARCTGTDADFGFELELDQPFAAEGVAPGGSGRGRLSFWAVDELPGLASGQMFELREGTKVIGQGVVLDAQGQ